MIKIKVLTEKEVFSNEKISGALQKLVLSDTSYFNYDLADKRPGNYILAYDKKTIVGWSLMSKKRTGSNYQIGVFVSPEYRRRGIGSLLVKKAKELAVPHNIVAQDHDPVSEAFFCDNDVDHCYYEFYYGD